MPPSSSPPAFVFSRGPSFGSLAMPRAGQWAPKSEQFIASFIARSLTSSDENIQQLVVQVLTKIGVRGGESAEKIAPFVARALADYNILIPSAILLLFLFNFSIEKLHQHFDGVRSGFIALFSREREAIDELNRQQLRHIWLHDEPFTAEEYKPIEKFCNMITVCFTDAITNGRMKGSEEGEIIRSIAEDAITELTGKAPPAVSLTPFDEVKKVLRCIADKHFAKALQKQQPSAEALDELLEFIAGPNGTTTIGGDLPRVIVDVIEKNSLLMNIAHLRKIAEWKDEVMEATAEKRFLNRAIQNAVLRIKDTANEELSVLLPKLAKFAPVQISIVAQEDSCRDFGGRGVLRQDEYSIRRDIINNSLMKKACKLSSQIPFGGPRRFEMGAPGMGVPPPPPPPIPTSCCISAPPPRQNPISCFSEAAAAPPPPPPPPSSHMQAMLSNAYLCQQRAMPMMKACMDEDLAIQDECMEDLEMQKECENFEGFEFTGGANQEVEKESENTEDLDEDEDDDEVLHGFENID